MLTDWSDGVEARNYKIPHTPDSHNLADLLLRMGCILVIAGALVGYVRVRSQIISLGYAIQNLKETEATLTRRQNSLILEEETLKRPERIDLIARNELGMEPLAPYQRVTLKLGEMETRPANWALADNAATNVQPRRPSADHN